eukprot:9842098-Ditylum_brightwellii.AAC.1
MLSKKYTMLRELITIESTSISVPIPSYPCCYFVKVSGGWQQFPENFQKHFACSALSFGNDGSCKVESDASSSKKFFDSPSKPGVAPSVSSIAPSLFDEDSNKEREKSRGVPLAISDRSNSSSMLASKGSLNIEGENVAGGK